MATFKNTSGHPMSITRYELTVAPDATFEVLEEDVPQFEANPAFESSRVKNPDETIAPAVVSGLTGPIPTTEPAPAA